ncbi:hypothetical protein [Microbispora hainanensis]|uniref:Uncharacterized protein n=1 Tax=Microbispora hainanensis TaxID=568844 RepID=A0ABZ1T0M5_9ACTN|nr:hypothetical protein [Microbispora hainanensis]
MLVRVRAQQVRHPRTKRRRTASMPMPMAVPVLVSMPMAVSVLVLVSVLVSVAMPGGDLSPAHGTHDGAKNPSQHLDKSWGGAVANTPHLPSLRNSFTVLRVTLPGR